VIDTAKSAAPLLPASRNCVTRISEQRYRQPGISNNAKLNKMAAHHCPSDSGAYMYDHHVLSLACYLGEIVFDNRPHQLWRRHDDSVTSASHAVRFSEVRLVKGLRLSLKRLAPPYKNSFAFLAMHILDVFSAELDDSERSKLLLVATYRHSLTKRLRLLRDKEFLAGLSLYHRMFFRFLALCGAF
jgi:hypothetical protein